jgi:hypothetical protein
MSSLEDSHRGSTMRLAILGLLWFGATAWYWDRAIPLAPTLFTQLEGLEGPYFRPAAGEYFVTHRGPPRREGGARHGFGPIEFREVQTGRIKRQLFDETIQLKTGDAEERDRIVVEQEGRIRIVRLSTGETLCEVPEAAGSTKFMFAADGNVLLTERNGAVFGFDPSTGERLWIREDIKIAGYIQNTGPRFAPLLGRSVNGPPGVRSFTRVEVVDYRTGEPAPVIGALPDVHRAVGTTDGRLMAVHQTASFGCTVYDAETGKVLWTKERSIPDVARFNEDGAELQVPYQLPDGTLGVARWASADGRELSPLPWGAQGSTAVFSADGRLAVDYRTQWNFPQRWWGMAMQYNWNRLAQYLGPRTPLTVIDVQKNRVIGSLHPEENLHQSVDAGRGIVTRRNFAVAYYTLPPGRDWLWLLKWGVVPPVALSGISRTWRWMRRTRASSAMSAPIESAPTADRPASTTST